MAIPAETVCRHLQLDIEHLQAWLDEGLIEADTSARELAFSPAQVRRIWSIASLQRDLDVNLEGVRIILELSDRMRAMQGALEEADRRLQSLRRLDAFRLRVVEEFLGPLEWDIEL